jgi:hypothetical protein
MSARRFRWLLGISALAGALVLGATLANSRTYYVPVGLENPGDAEQFAGTWELTLQPALLRWPFNSSIQGELQIAAPGQRDSLGQVVVCTDCLSGTFALRSSAGLRSSPLGDEVQGHAFTGGALFIALGECCDRGGLELRGRRKRDVVKGRWEQAFISDGPRGTFVLRRARQEIRPPDT